jgi:hypothetical protein
MRRLCVKDRRLQEGQVVFRSIGGRETAVDQLGQQKAPRADSFDDAFLG